MIEGYMMNRLVIFLALLLTASGTAAQEWSKYGGCITFRGETSCTEPGEQPRPETEADRYRRESHEQRMVELQKYADELHAENMRDLDAGCGSSV
jgi:hypothetical protein